MSNMYITDSGRSSVKKLSKLTVCIVDDNRELVHIMTEYLNEQEDMEVVGVAHDGKECLQLLNEVEPDILLLDIIMPHLDGLAVLQKRSEERRVGKECRTGRQWSA